MVTTTLHNKVFHVYLLVTTIDMLTDFSKVPFNKSATRPPHTYTHKNEIIILCYSTNTHKTFGKN